MAQIFISHSAKDKEYKDFFNQAFAASDVSAKYEEIEKLVTGQQITAEKIKNDITQSNAVFVLLSQNIQDISHTNNWVVSETGIAAGLGREIWLFENIKDSRHLTIATPYFNHYVIYDNVDSVVPYIKDIVESYSDGRVLKNMAKGSIGGAAITKEASGAILGAIGGLIYSAVSTGRPPGVEIRCMNCFAQFHLHVPPWLKSYRCPSCNTWWNNPFAIPLPSQ
jgi:hypothetical protein